MTQAEAKVILNQYREKAEARGITEINSTVIAKYLDKYRNKIDPELIPWIERIIGFGGVSTADNMPNVDPTKL